MMNGHGDVLRAVPGTRGVTIRVIVIEGTGPLSDEANRCSSDQDDRNAEDDGKHR